MRTVLDKQNITGGTDLDQRGLHAKGNKVSEERRQSVIDHIASVPMLSSHYSRAKSPYRKYLPHGINVTGMYNLYIDWLKDMNEINILKEEKRVHLSLKKDVKNIMNNCKNIKDHSIGVLCFDLQQTLPAPKIATGLAYYKRKLWVYVFCIHNIKTGYSVMYTWNETVGKRGSAEVASCLLHYFEHFLDDNVKTLKMFSDNCSGQNKNINVVLACLQKIHEERFIKIEHNFMEPGHSYLPCDRDFGHIQQKLRGVEVFSQTNYTDIIKSCRRTKPFIVQNMTRNQIVDIEVLQATITNRTKTLCNFSKGKVFVFDANYKQGFTIKSSFNDTDPAKVRLQKGRKQFYDSNIFDLGKQNLPQKYTSPIKLNVKKLEDLQAMLLYIPPHHKAFTEDLITEQQNLSDLYDKDDHDPNDDLLDYC